MGKSSDHLQQDAQAQMHLITRAVGLAHQCFGAVVLALHKALADALWEELKEGEDFFPLATYSRERPSARRVRHRGGNEGPLAGRGSARSLMRKRQSRLSR